MYLSWDKFFKELPEESRDNSQREGEAADELWGWLLSDWPIRIDLILTDITDI